MASGLYLIGDVLYEEGASENLTLFRRQYKNRTLSSKEFLELLSHEDSPIGKLSDRGIFMGKEFQKFLRGQGPVFILPAEQGQVLTGSLFVKNVSDKIQPGSHPVIVDSFCQTETDDGAPSSVSV